jgi:hypothetical protein
MEYEDILNVFFYTLALVLIYCGKNVFMRNELQSPNICHTSYFKR